MKSKESVKLSLFFVNFLTIKFYIEKLESVSLIFLVAFIGKYTYIFERGT